MDQKKKSDRSLGEESSKPNRDKKIYGTPNLAIYGDFSTLTLAKGGTKGDSDLPMTRA